MKTYFAQVLSELRKVTWPSKEQTLRQTAIVIAVSLGLAFYLGGLDYLFTQLLTIVINQG
jgi:preprotein translocase subunit SecE